MVIMAEPLTTASFEVEAWEPGRRQVPQLFILSAGAVLITTAVAKVWSALGNSKFLEVVDPIVGIKFGHLMLAVGLAELVTALVCFFSKRQTLALALVAWISTNFVGYRLGLWWLDWHRPGSCLGNLTDALHISPHVANNFMKAVLGYLLVGSYGLLAWKWLQERRTGTAGNMLDPAPNP